LDNQQASDRPGDVSPPDENQPIGPWLSRNITWLLLGAVLLGVVWYYMGTSGMWAIFKVAVGLSLIIFVHELGHFAVAKLCNVHVQTFSIGFGPAFPGCSFRWGETLYKLAVFPLGGYVKMVGEGDGDEGDDDPRSFKNKSVSQRMAIISAGVIMNILMACVCFIIAYRSGIDQLAGVIGTTDSGSPAWQAGVRPGMRVEQIGNVRNPYYPDLMQEVVLSGEGKILLIGELPGREPQTFRIEPRILVTDARPTIGVTAAQTTKFFPKRDDRTSPVFLSSPGAAARGLDLDAGSRIIAATDPDHPDQVTDLPEPSGDDRSNYAEFARRLTRLIDQPVKVRAQRSDGAKLELDLPPGGFQFDDEIIGTTDASPSNRPYDPYRLAELPVDKFRDPDGKMRDYFEYRKRMQILAGKPVVLQVRRTGQEAPALVFMPPAYHYTVAGVRMGMGSITAIRDDSPAKEQGVQKKDVLLQVKLEDNDTGDSVAFTNAPVPRWYHPWSSADTKDLPEAKEVRELDPLRLPSDLRRWAAGRKDVDAILTVVRVKERDESAHETLPRMKWDYSWQFAQEVPTNKVSPTAISELGLAYQVSTTVDRVEDNCAAHKAGLQKGDVILEVTFKETPKPGAAPEWIKHPAELFTEQKGDAVADKRKPEPWWAHVDSSSQLFEYHEIKVKVQRDNQEIELALEPDLSWPSDEHGLLLVPQMRLQKADGLADAVWLGMKDTASKVVGVYLQIRSVVTGRVSFFGNAQGPLGIAVFAYNIAANQPFNVFLIFLGFISVQLAVINFLPIPVLDGGHMVFLIYEKIRGRPASEFVRTYTTIAGLALILSLVLVLCFLDAKRHIFGL
jgi:membrane-associated protease RseP (regulator of RpoE activity)